MPTPKNGFQILNLHFKKHVFKEKKYPFFNVLLPKALSITEINIPILSTVTKFGKVWFT